MASMPPTSKFSGPPPGATPQGITSMIPPGRMEEDSMAPNPSGGDGGGLKDVFDEVSAVLDSLASILPDQAEEIDAIKTQLAEVLAKAISGGASFTGDTSQAGPIRGSEGLPV